MACAARNDADIWLISIIAGHAPTIRRDEFAARKKMFRVSSMISQIHSMPERDEQDMRARSKFTKKAHRLSSFPIDELNTNHNKKHPKALRKTNARYRKLFGKQSQQTIFLRLTVLTHKVREPPAKHSTIRRSEIKE
mmetsp:Transcript_23405/g.37435  ORF Transcript_23405/g.37435 Transcript_23405/m.37435 type:complete len:137 (+) Transcript_23405:34-444(+)